MKAIVKVIDRRFPDAAYTVEIKHGVQSFTLHYRGTLDESKWMAKMFNKALAAHDAEIYKKEHNQ